LSISILTFYTTFWLQYTNVDVPSKGWSFPPSVIFYYLRHSPITDSVAQNGSLSCPVSWSTPWSRTAITAILCLPQVSLTGGVGSPGTICCAEGVYVSPCIAVKHTPVVDKPLCTVTRYSRAQAWYLILHPWFMLYTPGDISPGTISLT